METLGAIRIRVTDTQRSEAFFGSVFGWSFHHGRVAAHREVTVTGTAGTEPGSAPPVGLVLTDDPGEPPARLCLSTPDPDTMVESIRELGGRTERRQPSPHVVACLDDQSTPLLVYRPASPVDDRHSAVGVRGVLGVIFVFVADPERAAAFYADLLGWRFEPIGRDGDILFLQDGPPLGLRPMAASPTGVSGAVTFHIAVPEAEPVVADVEALGGHVGPAHAAGAFLTRACVDDQGTSFSLWYEP